MSEDGYGYYGYDEREEGKTFPRVIVDEALARFLAGLDVNVPEDVLNKYWGALGSHISTSNLSSLDIGYTILTVKLIHECDRLKLHGLRDRFQTELLSFIKAKCSQDATLLKLLLTETKRHELLEGQPKKRSLLDKLTGRGEEVAE